MESMMRRRNVIMAPVHFVWATYDRLPMITEEMERRVGRYIEAVCHDMGCTVLALGIMPDHVHLLVNLKPTVSYSEIMKRVKGSSSRFISETLKGGDWFAWQENYGAFGVDMTDMDGLLYYITHQKEHHADNTLVPLWETTFEEYEVPDDAKPD
jgi:putative transposase